MRAPRSAFNYPPDPSFIHGGSWWWGYLEPALILRIEHGRALPKESIEFELGFRCRR